MAKIVCLDTGPLVAFLAKRDRFHPWASKQFDELNEPMVTCESVLSETLFLMNNNPIAIEAIKDMISDELIVVKPVLSEPKNNVFENVLKYSFIPGSLADLSLIYLYEQQNNSKILTLDSDFLHYRDRKGKHIDIISPY